MKALANEIAKNLVLAGIGSLTIVDHELVSGDDLCSQFFVSEEDIGKNVSAEQQLGSSNSSFVSDSSLTAR
jgi:molybdopterin/thiamine biosynthesis adenylyltransferase